MADFHSLIARAIASMQDPTPEARRAVYERARAALDHQLRAIEPALSETDIARQRLNLDEAINRLEAEIVMRSLAVGHEIEAVSPNMSASPADDVDTNASQRLAPPEVSPRKAPASIISAPPRERPRMETRGPDLDPSDRRRAIILGSVLGVVILGIAAIAFMSRDQKPRMVAGETAEVARPSEAETKFDDRVGSAARAPEARPATEPRRVEGSGGTPTQGTTGTPRGEVPVAQRAFMFEEAEAGAQEPKVFGGRAIWRLDAVNDGQGQPSETTVRADIDLAEAGLTMTFVVRRNVDASLPASHLVQMSFARSELGQERSVRDIAVPQFKVDESSRGTPLSGLVVPVTENVFLVGLANIPGEVTRNVEMMRTRSWVDVPIRFANGKRAMITFEKGASGDRVIAEALAIWR